MTSKYEKRDFFIAAAVVLFFILLTIAGCGGGAAIQAPAVPAPPATPVVTSGVENLPLTPGVWVNEFDPDGSAPMLTNAAGGGFQFTFPPASPNTDIPGDPNGILFSSIHYLLTPYTTPLTIASTLVVTINIVAPAGATFNYVGTGGDPANCRPILERAGDAPYWTNPDYRWWPHTFLLLQGGQQTLTVSLDPDNWSNVNGTIASSSPAELAAFQDVLANMGNIGLTFGGASDDGHGVNATNSPIFTMMGYQAVHQ